MEILHDLKWVPELGMIFNWDPLDMIYMRDLCAFAVGILLEPICVCVWVSKCGKILWVSWVGSPIRRGLARRAF